MTTHYGNLSLSAFPFDIFPLGSICSTLLTFTLYGFDISPSGEYNKANTKTDKAGEVTALTPLQRARRRCKGGGGQAANGPARAGPNPFGQ